MAFYSFPVPDNDVLFENLVCDLLNAKYESTIFQLWGRGGQHQSGLDIYSSGKGIGVQCKWKDQNRNRVKVYKELIEKLKTDVEKAKHFKKPLKEFILVTTVPADTRLQEVALNLTDIFRVVIWDWKIVEKLLSENPKVAKKYYVDFLNSSETPSRFQTHRSVSENHFGSSQRDVFLNAHLPSIINGGKGSCCISFKGQDSPMTTLRSSDIEWLVEARQVSIDETIAIGPIKQRDNSWLVTLGSSAIYLNEQGKTELCYMVNDFLNEYQKAVSNYKRTLGASKFEITKSNNIKLLTVTRGLWSKMLRFSHEFDFDRGKTEWHIFSEHRSSIVVIRPDAITYNTWLNVERLENALNDFEMNPEDEDIDVVWRVPGLTDINSEGVWNAEISYKWLTEQYIPKVVEHYKPKAKKGALQELLSHLAT